MERQKHWEDVYRTKQPTEVSWHAPHLTASLRMIRELSTPESSVIDVGGGASTLVDDLLDAGYRKVAVLDVSARALELARVRLGNRGAGVEWLRADVTTADLPDAAYDIWHDRAVFHFLTDEGDRRAYARTLTRTLKPGGYVIILTFSLSGPEKCSGLDVMRYDPLSLQRELGPEFSLTTSETLVHVTPAGKQQSFVVCGFRRSSQGNDYSRSV